LINFRRGPDSPSASMTGPIGVLAAVRRSATLVTCCAGQLNVPDIFTRTMLSVVATGIAPGSFYELDANGNRQRAHYDGLPVDFIAEAIATRGLRSRTGLRRIMF